MKEYYFYLDATPTHSYLKMLYKYPQSVFPYGTLVDKNRNASKQQPAENSHENCFVAILLHGPQAFLVATPSTSVTVQ